MPKYNSILYNKEIKWVYTPRSEVITLDTLVHKMDV